MQKKYDKAEDFIGWKSKDGLLEVIGIHGKQGRNTIFKVICNKCKEDPELFPDGYFISTKNNLIAGNKLCGCGRHHRWSKEQYLMLARRAAQSRFIVHGFSEEFHGARTKLNLECLKDGHKWTASITNIINNGNGCLKCKVKNLADAQRTDEQEALNKCKEICEMEGYKALGFVGDYKNVRSRFEYKCQKHGKQNVCYDSFVNGNSRCKGCYKEKQKEISGRNGYYTERKDEQDFLYVLNFDDKFIKVGRSFDVNVRVRGLRRDSKIKKIQKLRIFTATHQEIYDLEQKLHSELRERNFQHYVDWSTECFTSDSLPYLNMLLDKCGLEEVKI